MGPDPSGPREEHPGDQQKRDGDLDEDDRVGVGGRASGKETHGWTPVGPTTLDGFKHVGHALAKA